MNDRTLPSAISVRSVSKSFRGKVALENVSFDVSKGTVFALLGENGAGKTTLIRSILGLEVPDEGSVNVMGMNPAKQGIKIRRKLGYVADSPSLYSWMTVNEIGWFASGFYPSGFQKQYQDLCVRFDLPPATKIKNLSRGMRAKLNLSLALAHQPEVIIMDEPTSGLDTVVRRRFLESMIDIATEGRTVFLASHQIPEVERVADIVAIISQGRIQVVERLESLKARLEWWTVLLNEEHSQLPELGINVLLKEGRNRAYKLLVDSATTDQLCRLREHDVIATIDVDVPSLEEIFVAYVDKPRQHREALENPIIIEEPIRIGEEVQ